MKMHLKISSVKWWPFCSGGDELMMTLFSDAYWVANILLIKKKKKAHLFALSVRLIFGYTRGATRYVPPPPPPPPPDSIFRYIYCMLFFQICMLLSNDKVYYIVTVRILIHFFVSRYVFWTVVSRYAVYRCTSLSYNTDKAVNAVEKSALC